MAMYYDPNASAYWSYSPYPYSQSFETSSSTSSSMLESPTGASSPRITPMMYQRPVSVYAQSPMYYYSCPPANPVPQVVSPPPTHLPNRLQYTVRQRWLLNEIFQHVPYPNSVQKNVIADRVGATREQIRIWFQNRRRIAVQGHRAPSQRSPPLPPQQRHAMQSELDDILSDLDLHRNAPQRMPVGQNSTSRSVRRARK